MTQNQIIDFTIPGQPKAWKRAGRGRWGGTYDASSKDKKVVRDYAFAAGISGAPWPGPVQMHVKAYLQRPKRLMRLKDPEGTLTCLSKPDSDNIIKLIKDALNKVAYRDDSQVWQESVMKVYHEKSGAPRTEIRLEFQ